MKWVDIKGYDGLYQVSDTGLVRSWSRLKNGKTLKPVIRKGYKTVNLSDGKKITTRNVHRLVVDAFLGGIPKGKCTRHLNGNRFENRVENLAVGTFKENGEDKINHGTSCLGRRNGNNKLTEKQVIKIKSMLSSGKSTVQISKLFGVTETAIYEIKQGKNWGWLTGIESV